tara:strand:+ start:848 stop:2539 length:1692 start_codon:yes stop_codon:yes gene_type:complete
MEKEFMKPAIVRAHYHDHTKYWEEKRTELRELRNAYMTRYWSAQGRAPQQITVETSRGYEFVEGYIASLFARSPSVIVKGDVRGRGESRKVQALCNNFLGGIRSQLEDASRLALINPCAFIKLLPNNHADPFKRVSVVAIPPWNVIVDTDAGSWSDQKFVAHRYYITLKEAQDKYGLKKYSAHPLIRFLDRVTEDQGYNNEHAKDSHPEFEYVEIVEFYDLVADKLYVWSPDYRNGEKYLYDGVLIPEGGEDDIQEVKYAAIPFRDSSDNPITPIVPLFYSRQPDIPMRGYSALRRVYDQVQEVNILRTYQASMVRRAARQWVVESGVFDAEAMSKLAQGNDGEFIEVELSQGQQLSNSILAVPHTPVPAELERYVQQVQDDFERGSVLAPFTRGESSRATATEITALAAYSSSEIGRLARERDAAIENIAMVYISMMKLYLKDEGDVILIDGAPEIITVKDLTGDFTYYANDTGATPVSEAVKKQEYLAVMPTLLELGVPVTDLLNHLVRILDLPQSFISAIEGASEEPQQEQAVFAEEAVDQSAGMQGQPSPADIQQFLPQ